MQPLAIPEQISAVTNTTRASLLNKNNVKKANGNALTNSSNNNNKNDLNNEIVNNSNNINNSNRSSTNSGKYPGSSTVKKKLKRNFIQSNEANNNNNNININNETMNQTPISNQLIQPQLVPIQKFSFFRWEINVDTLVRLFIVALVQNFLLSFL